MTKGRPEGEKALRYEVRELRATDLRRGLIETLGNLSDLEGLTSKDALKVLRAMRLGSHHHIIVAVEPRGKVVGATTLLVEQKFIHHGGLVGHIEDVVVRKGYEGRGVGRALVDRAIETARRTGCYKCILDCKPELVGFYEQLGLSKHDVGMRVDLKPVSRAP